MACRQIHPLRQLVQGVNVVKERGRPKVLPLVACAQGVTCYLMRSAAWCRMPGMAMNVTTAPERRTVLRSLANIEAVLLGIHDLLAELLAQEEEMSSTESAEAQALSDATAALEAELADVEAVDGEVVADLAEIPTLLAKFAPVSPDQVNAVAAVTAKLTSLTANLKAQGAAAASAEAGAGGAAPAATGGVTPTPTETAANTTESSAAVSTGAPGVGAGSDTPAPPPGSSTAAAEVPQPAGQAVYTYDGGVQGAVEDDRFAVVQGFRSSADATPPHAPLLHFNGDTTDGVANGVSAPGYVAFTGTPEVIPAS